MNIFILNTICLENINDKYLYLQSTLYLRMSMLHLSKPTDQNTCGTVTSSYQSCSTSHSFPPFSWRSALLQLSGDKRWWKLASVQNHLVNL